MPENEDKIKKLYDTFVSDGYDMESEEDFRKNLSDSTKRKAAYDALVKEGYEMEPFEEFENNIGFGKIQTPVPEPAVQTEQAWQPTEQEKAEMIASTNRMMQNVETQIQDANERVDNIQEYGLNPGLQTKEGKMQFNPENGKLEKTYITPLGYKTTSKPLADIESFRYRQAADMSIGGQLRKANLRLQELKAKQAERASEVHKEWVEETEKNKAPLAAMLGAATYTPRQQSDKENSALRVAIRETEELIKNLEEQKDRENGVDVGFWRGFGRTMGDVRTWDFGMGDMADAMTMMNADKLKGDNATEGERESHDMMMGAIHEKQQAEERYGGNADFWNRAGVMTGYMPSFMLDFILTGGGFNGLSTFSKGSTKVAAKVIGKETAEKMAQQGFKSYIKENGVRGLGQYAADWTIKALGTTADDLLVRAPAMTNTIQTGKTVSDIIDRKLGDVVVDENGNYDFSNDKTWGSAIWQGEANAIIENYSEMFGAHLDPIFTLGNMSKLANVLGAKRLGGVLSKADAGALNSIMGQTHQMFNKMGVSDYVGEVSEEYYGQLWRTMLSLDDAYQQNPDGTRTNLFATGQFHGDIWGGMALSMGLMGAGKHTLSAANYASMKHGVNKADAKVNELLGKEVWEPLKATLDLTTNENIGEVAELVAGDKDFTADEKAAVLNYMERSLNLRGFNLASMARSRGGVQSESEQQANDSYLDGYNVTSSQEMNDAKNLYEYHRTQVADLADENMFAMIEENPIAALEFVNGNEQWSDEDKSSVIDYINAKQVYNGMIQRVRDDIDGRVEQSNSMIDARVNRKTGMIQGATMKQDERKVYVLSGTLVPYADGSGVSVTDSDNSIIVRDADTGGLEQVSPDAILSIDDVQDPYEQKELVAQSIREQFAREAADKIDGVVTFNPGETYTIVGEGGSQIQVTIVSDENGIIDNGDGTINVTDGTNVFPIAKEVIQQFVDAFNIARIAEFEQQRAEENFALQQEEQEADRPQYAMNDLVTLRDENGIGIRGNITADVDADGLYEVYTEDALNGKRVNMFTREELDSMLIEHNGQPVEIANSSVNDNSEVAASSLEEQQLQVSALERIPKDEQGNPIYEQAETPDLAWDAIVEQTEGDEAMAQSVANGMVVDKEAALKKIEKTKSAGGNTIAEKIVAEKERKAAIDAAKQELSIWQKIAGTANRRKMEADAERRRIADEATALRKAEEEKLRAEREEAERKEREALNGVPDIVEDVPKDARARGYRRVNGHKVDRQGPLQAVQGKEVNVKFSNDVVVPGNVTVIDASLLQPSHIQGVRNPLHFIDEAQPKERNDEASVLSARKIAENIRPEEITSSITAYTGAPTVNERGEVIQGNNRSDALRLMWESHSEQAEAYRQYLKDHAEEFGLRAEDIAPIQSPVLVNMLHVDDTEALNLGQFVAQDTESGGVERIKPKNTLQRMGTEMRSFANLLLRTSDDEMSFAGLVDANGANVLKWMSQRGFISHTQYKSAFDSKGNLTPESKNDLRGIMYQSIFKDGSTRLEEMFNVLPVKAQKAILATAFRDYDSPNSERMVDEIQNSVRAYYALSQDKMFAEAKNFKEARIAVENWKRQYQMDDVTGESYLPADNFSNFVLHLAAMYKGESQSFIQNTFGKIYDLIQGTQEETLFEQPDNTPRTLVQAIKEALNLDYNGQQRSNVLVGDTATSQRGQQGSNGALAPRERVEDGNGTTDDTGRTESIGEQSEIEPSLSQEEMLSSDDTDNQLSAKIARRIEVQEDDWVESGKYGDTYKQTIIVDGTHKVIKVDAPDTKGNYTGSTYEYDGQTFGDLLDVVNYIDASSSLANAVAVAEKETDTTPTEKQKEAGGVKDKIPEMEGGKAQDLYLPQTRALRSIMKFVKNELEHYEQMSGKEKKENSHIPLTMYGIAKAAAVDARLVQSDAEDDVNSKTHEAVRQTLRSLKETADYKGTVAIFADNYQNKQSGFNLYDDIRDKLITEGVPADEIVIMRSGMTVKKKLEIFEKVNRGEVRVILGSTFTLGTGVNIQERLHTLIHLDAPNRPMDYTQRNGRILRQGNLHKDMNKPIRILRFGVEDSLDVTAYQRLKTKGAIADSIMNGKQMMSNSMTNRVLEEEEDVFGDTIAQLSGSEYAMLKNNAEKNVRKYASRKKQWETDQAYIHNAKPRLKAFIKDAEKRIEDNSRSLEAVRASFPDEQFKEIVIGKHRFTSVDTMDDFFKEHNKTVLAEMKQMKDGDIAGEQKRELTIQIGNFPFIVTTKLTRQTMRDGTTLFNDVERKMTYSCTELGIEDVPVRQNLLRNAIEDITGNVITGKNFAERLEAAERSMKHNETELKELLSREGKPFEYEEELAQAKSQLEEYAELMKKELEEKEAKYAEMDATVETANNVSTSEEDDELKREDDGAYTDDEVSYDNDSVAKLLGQSRRTAKQRRKFAQRERQRMAERVVSLTEKLHLDNVEVVTDASTLDGKKQRAKGFYSKSTGKITIVIPNHTSMFDVEQTLLHEAVAHYGLRQLFGEHFDTFLDNVFNNADEIIRRRIVDMASKNGWDFRKATEEYLAGLAEHINFEEARKNGWWQRIKQFFFEMLDKLGFSDFRGVTLTDNELRYILWRSYENLKEGKHSNLFGEAADIAMQHKLMVGEFADTSTDDVLNRDGDPEIHERTLARAKYEQRVKSGMYQSQEALQDSMLGLKEAMNAILGKNTRMEDVDGFENAYLGENRLSSVNKAEADAFAHLLFKPMLEEVAKLAHNTAEREELTDYMMAKHGLERNRVMAERDAQKDFAEYQKQHSKSTKTLQNFIDECRKRDYAGLTALTGMEEIADAEAEALVMVDEYENAHDTTALWSKVNAVSKAVLSKSYECGMMSKETYDSVRDMYEFYIPLRGFDEKTSSEAYAYLTHRQSAFNAPIKKAEGRKSKADDPFAYLQSMAEGTIMQGNRNKLVKQKFLNFALNHPSDLVSVSDLWLQYDAVSDEWKPIFPDNIDINDSPEEVERKLNEFEDKMKQLAESAPDNYKHGKDAANIPYRVVESRDLRQHQVVVKRNGRDYVITINGNPRAAQALNGQTNPDNDISGSIGQLVHLIGDVNRTLSSLYTTLQPDFIASNFLRDMVYSNSMVWVKESPKYAIQYNMNFAKLPIVRMVMLLDKYRRGTLDMNDEIEKMFYQFMMNGGETGFSRMADIDEHKKEIKKMLKAANEKIPAHVVRECMATWIGEVGRGIEMRARFAAFVTSRNAGRTIDRSIWDAKEISVNFNKKGAGDKFLGAEGQTMLGNVAAGVSGAGRAGYIFWNAALQGTFGNFLKYAMRHPGKMGTVVASWYGLAMLVTALASAGGDDDDDSYYDIPEHTRRQNLIVKGPGNAWIKIPLPIEYRAVYAMGELTGSSLFHNEKLEVSDVLAQMSQLLPVDMMEGTKALWPSSVKPMVEVSNNESWYGSPIWKDTPYNKYMPNWTKAYKSANKDLVNLSETLNEVSGGSKYRKGTIDLNPAAIEYLLKQYTGGFFTVTNQIRNLINVGTGEKDFDWRYVPLANRMLMSGGDERNVGRGLDEKFFGYLDAYRAKASEFSAIKGDLSLPLEKKAELISEIIIDPEYVKMKGMERIYSKLKKAYDTAKEIGDTSKAEELEKRINELKRTFILEMEQDERK